MTTLIVADVGGTNSRLALYEDGQLNRSTTQKYKKRRLS